MRRSTLWMCALLAIATSGCEQVKEQFAKVKAKIDAARGRTPPAQPTAGPVMPQPQGPVPTTPQEPAAKPTPPPRRTVQAPALEPALRDIPYDSPDTGTIAPGMTEKDVYSLWGPPVAVRRQAEMTFLYYRNGCEYTCGTEDVVFLQTGRVVDAVLRWPGHLYSGQSSSPTATMPHPRRGGDTLSVKPQNP
ncbi:MAG TPA: hypothetical protein VF882_01215 [Gemmatimonadales bacterium]